MILSRKKLKKVPLPWGFAVRGDDESKIEVTIRRRFQEMYGERTNLSTSEMKDWGEFLMSRGIHWDIRLSKKPNWEGWEFFRDRGVLKGRPKGLEDHMRVLHYYVPRDLALKMLVLGDLP